MVSINYTEYIWEGYILYDWYRICKKRRQNKKTKDVYEKLF